MKYVIMGSGNISNTYIRAIRDIPQSEIIGCVSRSGKSPSASPQIPNWQTLEEIPLDFDAVIIATPNGLHTEGIIESANRGKHIVCEKPLGIRSDEMKKALDAVEKNKITLAVAYQRRTSPDNIRIKEMIAEGQLGKIFAADLSAKFYRDQAYYDSGAYRGGWKIDGGGPFIQQACHNIDLYVWYFGLPEQIVSMMDTFTHDIEVEDHGAVLLRYENGMIGTITSSTSTLPGFAARLEVHSDKGSFTMIDDRIAEWYFPDIPNPANTSEVYAHDGATSAAVSDTSAHKKILLNFEDCVKNGKTPISDGKSAQLTSEFILKIYQSNLLNNY